MDGSGLGLLFVGLLVGYRWLRTNLPFPVSATPTSIGNPIYLLEDSMWLNYKPNNNPSRPRKSQTLPISISIFSLLPVPARRRPNVARAAAVSPAAGQRSTTTASSCLCRRPPSEPPCSCRPAPTRDHRRLLAHVPCVRSSGHGCHAWARRQPGLRPRASAPPAGCREPRLCRHGRWWRGSVRWWRELQKCCPTFSKNVAKVCKMLTNNSWWNQHFWKMLEHL
jgi:hypothetical protein